MGAQHKFKVGDMARVIKPGSKRLGAICRVLDNGGIKPVALGSPLGPTQDVFAYAVDLEPDPGYAGVCYSPDELEPYYDGNERASWSDCVWQPNNVRVC